MILKRLIPILVFVSIGAYLIREIFDFDIWWHIVIGRDILANLAVPVTDAFTAGGAGNPYHDSHWFFQVIMAAVDASGGISAVILATALFYLSLFYLIYRHCRLWLGSVPSAVLLAMTAAASLERFSPRPELCTFAMIVCFMFLLSCNIHRKTAGAIVFPLLQAIWVNSHGLFVIGPAILFVYLAAELPPFRKDSEHTGRMIKLFILVLLATLISPYGVESWRYAWLLFSEVGPGAPQILKNVGELSPTFGAAFRGTSAFWLYIILVVLAIMTRIYSALFHVRRPTPVDIVMIMLLALSFTGRRNTVLFIMAVAPYIASHLSEGYARVSTCLLGYAGKWAGVARYLSYGIISAVLIVWGAQPVSGRFYERYPLPTRFGISASSSIYPVNLPEFLKRVGFKGQIFNSNILGGFYLYNFYPEQKPYIDGRWEVYAPDFFPKLAQTLANPLLFEQFVLERNISGLLLAHGTSEAKLLTPGLTASKSLWRLVYYDYTASFWMRSGSMTLPLPADLSRDAIMNLPRNRIESRYILDEFLVSMGQTELRTINFQKSLDEGFRIKGTYEVLGNLYQQLGEQSKAEDIYSELLNIDPGNPQAINELAYGAYLRGDSEKAMSLLQEGLAKNPGNITIKANIERITNLKVPR